MTDKKEQSKEAVNVEFGMEFGDLNSSKFYELAYANQSQNKESPKNKHKK
jgi:hypothetical protein